MKKLFVFILLFGALFLGASQKNPKYVFLFIGDGMATPQRMIAEEFSQKTLKHGLVMNTFPFHGTTRTASANSLVTDSAAAGTAIACGKKTNNGSLGVDVKGNRLESVAEVAKKLGKKVGILTSVTINHATPGAFYAHRRSRAQYYAIGLDLVASDFDYFAGGGMAGHADDTYVSEYKGNIYEMAAKAGYQVTDKAEVFRAMKPVPGGKYWARSCENIMPYCLDLPEGQPDLAEYTAKGIELLDNPAGFFMMVEGGAVDWHGHSNDAASNLYEVLALDKAIRLAVDFYRKHQDETLIVVTGDHETGGMTMGFAGTGYALYVERLANQKCSVAQFKTYLKDARKKKKDFAFADAQKMLEQYFGFIFDQDSKNPMKVTASELKTLQDAFAGNRLPDAARRLISNKAGVGWTSGAHTALPVLTTAIGVRARDFAGFYENTEISVRLKKILAD